jgi:hypothetical protein
VLQLCPKVQDMHLLQNEEINTKEVTEPPDYEEQRTLDNTTLLMCKPIQSTDVSTHNSSNHDIVNTRN